MPKRPSTHPPHPLKDRSVTTGCIILARWPDPVPAHRVTLSEGHCFVPRVTVVAKGEDCCLSILINTLGEMAIVPVILPMPLLLPPKYARKKL